LAVFLQKNTKDKN